MEFELELYEEIEPKRVRAVLVTSENQHAVAKWCKGQVWQGGGGIELPVARGERMRTCPRGWLIVQSGAGDFSIMTPKDFYKKYREPRMVKIVPLVHYKGGERHVIGSAEVKPDGTMTTWLTEADFAQDNGLDIKHGKYSLAMELVISPDDKKAAAERHDSVVVAMQARKNEMHPRGRNNPDDKSLA